MLRRIVVVIPSWVLICAFGLVPHMLRCSFGVGVRSFVCQLFAGQPRRCGLFALVCQALVLVCMRLGGRLLGHFGFVWMFGRQPNNCICWANLCGSGRMAVSVWDIVASALCCGFESMMRCGSFVVQFHLCCICLWCGSLVGALRMLVFPSAFHVSRSAARWGNTSMEVVGVGFDLLRLLLFGLVGVWQ